MEKLLDATYEGDRVIRLDRDLHGLHPHAKVKVMVLTPSEGVTVAVNHIGLEGLQKELADFEAQYNISSAEFYRRFRKGEMGDAHDFMTWAGLYEISLRLNLEQPDPAE